MKRKNKPRRKAPAIHPAPSADATPRPIVSLVSEGFKPITAEFQSTVFQVIPDNLPPSFFILTGWNPNGKEADFGGNSDRDNEIEKEIKKLRHFRVIGMSPDEKHVEPGWGFAFRKSACSAWRADTSSWQ